MSFNRTMSICEDAFGEIVVDGETKKIRKFTLSNEKGFTVQIINYGATITSILVPDKNNQLKDVVLGFDDIKGYLTDNNPYFGATIGRVCNRIRGSTFKIGAETFQLTKNKGENHLHGGKRGFDKVVWDAQIEEGKVVFTYLSRDGEEGYPGAVLVSVTYTIGVEENILKIEMQATCTKTTPINLTNHSYFNLGGHDSGPIYDQIIKLNANRYTVYDDSSIPTGLIASVDGTLFDLRKLTSLQLPVRGIIGGLDQNFCVNQSNDPRGLSTVGKLFDTTSGISMAVASNQVGVQVYSSNYFPDKNKSQKDEEIVGKGGVKYWKHHGICMETQGYPDSVNHPNFPSVLVRPGQIYSHKVHYQFGNRDDFLTGEEHNDPI